MVRGQRSAKKKSPEVKTYVFPYESLQPIVNINKDGSPSVKPFTGEKVERLCETISDMSGLNVDELTRRFESLLDERLRGAIRELSTQGEFEALRNSIDSLREISGSDKLSSLIRMSEEEMKARLSELEGEIVRRIEVLNRKISEHSVESGRSIKEVIDELQSMENDLMKSLNDIRDLVSTDVIRRSETTSVKITDFIIELDKLKNEIVTNAERNRDVVLDELKSLRGACEKQDVKKIVEGMKDETRRQIDRILESMQPREDIDRLRTEALLREEKIKEQRNLIQNLEQEIEANRFAAVDVGEINRLEGELEKLTKDLEKRTAELNDERNARLNTVLSNEQTQRELARVQSELQRVTSDLEKGMRDISRLETTEAEYDKLLNDFERQKKLLNGIERRVVEILETNDRPAMEAGNVSFNLANIQSLIDEMKSRSSVSTPQPPPPVPSPRYVVLRTANEGLELIDAEKETFNFTSEARGLRNDLYGYSLQIARVREDIRRYIYDSEYIFHVRKNLIRDLRPSDISQLFSVQSDVQTPTIIEDSTKPDRKRIGRYVLTDVFSAGVSPNITTNSNLVVASGVVKIFSYLDAIDLALSPFESYIAKEPLANSLRRIFRTVGKEITGQRKILYEPQDLFIVQMLLISDIREYVDGVDVKLNSFTLEGVYNIEARMILLDAFLKAFLEMKSTLDILKTYYGNLPVGNLDFPSSSRLLSYVRLRADGKLIDPRFSILLNTQTPGNEMRTKLKISHQPYVVSSLSMNDVETPYYEHDIYGPFTRVFVPSETNEDISNNVDGIVDGINSGRDVFSISLGPSGSGKTSTLLFFRGGETLLPSKGVIPLLMNKLDSRFTKVRVTAFEFAANYRYTGGDDYWKRYDVFETPATFTRERQEWVSEKGLTIDTFSYSSSPDICEREFPFETLSRSPYTFPDGKVSIGDFLSRLIDIRLNCGTPMNPVSSRTHLFLFLKFMTTDGGEKEDSPTLIVADLAGREKAFDCSSEGILENFSLNKYYPTLNKLVNDPSDTPLFDRARERIGFPGKEISLNLSRSDIVRDVLTPLSAYSLSRLFGMLHLDSFFAYIKTGSSTGGGYVPDSKGLDVSSTFYKFLSRVFSYVLDAKFPEMLERRIYNIENQPLQLKNLLELMADKRERMELILRYFARADAINPGKNVLSGRSQYERLRSEIGRGVSREDFDSILVLMKSYLESLMIVEYLTKTLREKPTDVCRYRNIEGEFINRSLDELANLVLLASTGDSRGPLIHAECLPITCSFAGMDCLLPKNVPSGSPESAISRIIKQGTGKKNPRFDQMIFCAFVVLNVSKRPFDDRIYRPTFDSAEPLLRIVHESFNKLKADLEYSQNNTGETSFLPEFNKAYQLFMETYNSELKLTSDYRARLEYRGIEPSRMLNEDYKNITYRRSIGNWKTMKEAQTAMLNIIESPDIRRAASRAIVDMNVTIRKIKEFVDYLSIKNQDTSLGTLMFADNLVKYGLQPLSCTVFDSEGEGSLLPDKTGWSNVQYII